MKRLLLKSLFHYAFCGQFFFVTFINKVEQKIFIYKNSPISYYRFGNGEKVLVAFHGYDQTGKDFRYFEDVLTAHFTVIAIDFFWHGRSEWRETEDFTEDDMKNIVSGIAGQEHIVVRKFSVCSYSMGARMAWALVRTFPDRIEHFILLSPPTFSFNRFLNFTTNTFFGLRLFRYFLHNNKRLTGWVKILNTLKILNRPVYIFTSKFIVSAERLEKVYKTWYSQRKLRTDFGTFAKLINGYQIHVVLIAGKNDAIAPPQKMIRYIRKMKNRKIFIIRKKHELKTQETKALFEKLFAD